MTLRSNLRPALLPPLLLAVACSLLLPNVALQAQVPYDQCTDRSGNKIRGEVDPAEVGRFAALATWKDGQRIILWRPSAFNGASEAVQIFVYLHECAHHNLHHVDNQSSTETQARHEQEADCWAIQTMVEGQIIGPSEVEKLFESLKRQQGDMTHQDGDGTLFTLHHCLNDKTDRKRWFPVLDSMVTASHDAFESIAGPALRDPGAEGVREVTLDPPSTFDCELRPSRNLVCILFTGKTLKAADSRFGELQKVFGQWKPAGFTAALKENATPEQPKQFLLTEDATGGTLALILHRLGRIYLIYKPPAT